MEAMPPFFVPLYHKIAGRARGCETNHGEGNKNDASPYGDMMFFASLKMMLLPLVAMMRCLPQNVAKPRIIRRSRHHSAKPTSFAEGKHHSKNAPLSIDKSAFFVGGDNWIRTSDPLHVKQVL